MIEFERYAYDSKYTFEIAKRARTCRKICKINPGDMHLAVYRGDPAIRTNYCVDCAPEFLDETYEKLLKAQTAIKEVQAATQKVRKMTGEHR